MISDPHSLLDEDKRLRTSKLVNVSWNKSGYSYRSRGRITTLSRSAVTVTLLDRISYGDGYAAGSLVTVPRVTDAARWSSHNCVRLMSAAKPLETVMLAG